MSTLITPDELPIWVPGEVTVDSATLNWDKIRVRGYRYAPSDVPIPPLQDLLVVVYMDGATPMHRRCAGDWRNDLVAPGSISFLSHEIRSHWRWTEPTEVLHLYLSPSLLKAAASDLFEREIAAVNLRDVLRADDPVLAGLVMALAQETRQRGIGSSLYVDSIRHCACIHLLRHYTEVQFRASTAPGGLSLSQRRLVVRYVEDNLDKAITLADLAGVIRLSVFHFTRKFRSEFGCSPHAYVMQRRILRAKHQLARTNLPIKVIAANCGFSDQSHMTHVFRTRLQITPASYRNQA
ncbi:MULTISPECIES: AraC family transcriptional regulator [unclassified Methylobacterium]|jgi:AraC family transcriptional regulator|uniref:AraC family transcriptional regulator n=1 Tax=unclassified Methylobacterium TaxID=2615210 RepID=UPI00137012F8|nr:AraC family transcriptional regulator [Methylobacterium sp. 2A]